MDFLPIELSEKTSSGNVVSNFVSFHMGFSAGSGGKNPSANAGDAGLNSESGRSPGEGNGTLQCSSLANPMDRGAWWATVHGVARTQIQSFHICTHITYVSIYTVSFD